MYFSFKPQKIILTSLMALLLIGGVFATFSYKVAKFGDVHLATAMSRSVQRHATFVWYAAKFSGVALAAGPFSAFSKTEYVQGGNARAVPVLLYHGLRENRDDALTPKEFAEHMGALRKAGWKTITLSELEAFLRNDADIPARSFVLTFDDGARDSYYPVDPLLSIFGYNAVSFILPKYTIGGGTHYYLSSGEVNTMLNSGRWEIGSHGYESHEFPPIDDAGERGAALANLLWLPDEGRLETPEEFAARVTRDLSHSQAELEKEFSIPVTTFAFPFGEFGQLTKNYPEVTTTVEGIANSLYDLSFFQTWVGEGFSYNYPQENGEEMIMVKRIEPLPGVTGDELVAILEAGFPKDLPFNDDLSGDSGWFATWGSHTFDGSTLLLKSQETETGAAIVLDGTEDWENYRAQVTLSSPSQTGFVIWARFQDNDNNAACNFGNGFMHAEDTVNGEHRVINGVRDSAIRIPSGTFTVEVEVVDRNLTCTLNGTTNVTTEFLDTTLATGGIGIKIWDPEPGLSEFVVHDVSVEPL
jgi:peptidoglycan/xylan/chitin deacetylase (PgdA/CDA1 family)